MNLKVDMTPSELREAILAAVSSKIGLRISNGVISYARDKAGQITAVQIEVVNAAKK